MPKIVPSSVAAAGVVLEVDVVPLVLVVVELAGGGALVPAPGETVVV